MEARLCNKVVMDMDSHRQDGRSKGRLKNVKEKGKQRGGKMTIMIREVKG